MSRYLFLKSPTLLKSDNRSFKSNIKIIYFKLSKINNEVCRKKYFKRIPALFETYKELFQK